MFSTCFWPFPMSASATDHAKDIVLTWRTMDENAERFLKCKIFVSLLWYTFDLLYRACEFLWGKVKVWAEFSPVASVVTVWQPLAHWSPLFTSNSRRRGGHTEEIEITLLLSSSIFDCLVGRAFIFKCLPFLWPFTSFMHLLKRKETRKMFDSQETTQPLKVCRYEKKLPNNTLIFFYRN